MSRIYVAVAMKKAERLVLLAAANPRGIGPANALPANVADNRGTTPAFLFYERQHCLAPFCRWVAALQI
jgi:hypothetical protein